MSSLFRLIYKPLLKVTKTKLLQNSVEDLLHAILEGHIKYNGVGFVGVFTGTWSKELKKFGAVWSKNTFGWHIREDLLPVEVRQAISMAAVREEELRKRFIGALDSLPIAEVAENVKVDKLFEKAEKDFDTQFRKNVRSIAIPPKLSKEMKEQLAEEYTNNLKLYISKFTQEQVLSLRKTIESHAFTGVRHKSVQEMLTSSYGISKRKAAFLAEQETNLLTAKLQEIRYAEVGIDSYVWQTVKGSAEHPVRPMHKKLDGTTQRFSKPPVTNKQGKRNNPRQDYRCRCTAVPIVEF